MEGKDARACWCTEGKDSRVVVEWRKGIKVGKDWGPGGRGAVRLLGCFSA